MVIKLFGLCIGTYQAVLNSTVFPWVAGQGHCSGEACLPWRGQASCKLLLANDSHCLPQSGLPWQLGDLLSSQRTLPY